MFDIYRIGDYILIRFKEISGLSELQNKSFSQWNAFKACLI